MKYFYGFLLFLFAPLLLTGCSQPDNTPVEVNEQSEKENEGMKEGEEIDVGSEVQDTVTDAGKELKIVTTFPPLYAHTANIIDENDSITNLVPPGTSVHFWQPKPSDILAMEEADAIITNGLGLEKFLEGYLEGLEKKGVFIVDTSNGIETIEFGEGEDDHNDYDDHGDHDDAHHHHEGPDPHIWLDPDNAEIQVETILETLITLDPAQEEAYKKNAGYYSEILEDLDADIRQQISDSNIQPFVVFHDAYQYFLRAYDLQGQQIGLVQEFHGDNPSQKQIAELIQTIQDNGVKTIYTEPQFNPRIIQRLEQETGVISQEIDPIGSELSKDGYISMINQLAGSFSKQ